MRNNDGECRNTHCHSGDCLDDDASRAFGRADACVIGQAGILGEWELTATLTQETEGGPMERSAEPEARRVLQRGRAGRKDGRVTTEHVRAPERGHRDAADRWHRLHIPRDGSRTNMMAS